MNRGFEMRASAGVYGNKKRTFIFIGGEQMFIRSIAILGLLLMSPAVLFAQGGPGGLSGTVTDPNGAVVKGTAVKITNTATNLTRDTTTNDDGVYSFTL